MLCELPTSPLIFRDPTVPASCELDLAFSSGEDVLVCRANWNFTAMCCILETFKISFNIFVVINDVILYDVLFKLLITQSLHFGQD